MHKPFSNRRYFASLKSIAESTAEHNQSQVIDSVQICAWKNIFNIESTLLVLQKKAALQQHVSWNEEGHVWNHVTTLSHTCNLNSSAAAAPGATISWAVNQKISKTTSHSFEELAPRPKINVCFSLNQAYYESRHHTKITYAIPPHQEKTTDAYSQHCHHCANYAKM